MESFVLDPDFILNKIAETKEFQEWFPRSLIESKRKQIINIIINHQKGMEVEVRLFNAEKR
jgi:hypothetical protein